MSGKGFDYKAQLRADKKQQSAVVEGSQEKAFDQTETRRHPDVHGKELIGIVHANEDDKPNVTTMWELFDYGSSAHPDAKCLGTRRWNDDVKIKERGDYQWATYKETREEAIAFGLGLKEFCGLQRGDPVGIYAKNRAEWTIGMIANYSQTFSNVALYDTLGVTAVEYICNHAEIKAIICSKAKLSKMIPVLEKTENLKFIIQCDPDERYNNHFETVDEADVAKCAEHGVKLVGFSEIVKKGKEAENKELNAPNPEDLAFLMYTSGTTGTPKGAMLLHRNLIATISGLLHEADWLDAGHEVHYSYLPLAHIFESLCQALCWSASSAIGYFSGATKYLMDDLKTIQPTFFVGVPRVYSLIYGKLMAKVEKANCVKRFIVHRALRQSSDAIRIGERNEYWDKKIWSKFSGLLGFQRVKFFGTGAAPCPPYLLEFMKILVPGVKVHQGYGMTESAGVVSFTKPGDVTVGHVGPPLICSEIKLRDVPEMKYTAKDEQGPRGEVCFRGPNIFKGYFKNEEATKNTIDEDGWLGSGDIGRWNPNGTLSIIDRKKNIFKLSQGEYIAVEKIEGVYNKAPSVGQIWVYGNSFKSFIVAVVVPTAEWVCEHAKAPFQITGYGSPEERAQFKEWVGKNYDHVKTVILESLRAEETPLKGFEKVKDIIVEVDQDEMGMGFTVDKNTMTPSFKLKRPPLLEQYVDQLKELYTKNGQPPADDEEWIKGK